MLGTGGLVRAYTGATEKALETAQIIEKALGYEAKIQIEYNYLEPLKYYLEKKNIKIVNIEYLEKIEIIVETLENLSESIQNEYNEKNFVISTYETIREKFVEI